MKILITGGAGFIGSAVVRRAIADGHQVVNLDALTYSANLENVASVAANPRYAFEQADICDAAAVKAIFARHRPDAVMHLAAESHNDRAIDGPLDFVRTNVMGTAVLLEAARAHWNSLPDDGQGGLPLPPRLHRRGVRRAGRGRRLHRRRRPTIPTRPIRRARPAPTTWCAPGTTPTACRWCSPTARTTTGPFQFPEKLIPMVITRALEGKPIPVYGDGRQVRDWLHVDDHAEALLLVLGKGRLGETYCIGGDATKRNIEVIRMLCAHLDTHGAGQHRRTPTRSPSSPTGRATTSATPSTPRSCEAELGWKPRMPLLRPGLEDTVRWYVDNRDWVEGIRQRGFQSERLGLVKA